MTKPSTILIATTFFGMSLAATMAISGTVDTTYSANAVKAECSQKWGAQYDMVAYCINQKKEGHSEFVTIVKAMSGLPEIQSALSSCKSKWGVQWDMVNYCANQQIDGIRKIITLQKAMPKSVGDEIMGSCAMKWDIQFDMVAYCIEKNFTAWQSINQ